MTTALIPRIVEWKAAERRRSNYGVLQQEIGDRVDALFDEAPGGACPIAFLFRIDPRQRGSAHEALAAQGVRLASFWQVPHPSVPSNGFDRSRELRSSVVGLPVHQELSANDLDRIVDAFRKATRRLQ